MNGRWFVLLLLAGPVLGAPFELQPNGQVRLTAPGLPELKASLFLWYGTYIYQTPRDLTNADGVVRGTLKGSSEGAEVSFTMRPEPTADGLTVHLVLRRDAATELSSGMYALVELPLEPLAQRAARFSHGPAQLMGQFWDGSGRSWSVNLTDQQALTVSADRVVSFSRRRDTKDRVLVNLRLLPKDFPAEQDVPIDVTFALGPAGSERLPWQLESAEPLAIRSAKALAPQVAVNAPATIEADLHGTWQNPFDAAQVTFDAAVTRPDGTGFTIPGYLDQEFRAERVDDNELLESVGQPTWRVRFTPTMPGEWLVKLTAQDKSGRVESGPVKLTATASERPGMIRIADNRTYFEHSPGGGMFLLGHNLTTYQTGRQSMADALDKMAAGGENFTRLWMWSQHLGLENGQPVGTYRLQEAWRLDHAMDLARERGIDILLCLDTHQDFRGKGLPANPYHVSQGGPLSTPLEFFSNDEARRLYRNRLRYVVARWAHCTNLVAWEFVNEIEGWDGYQANTENRRMVGRWHKDMSEVIRGLDPYAHPITTSCWTTAGWPELWDGTGMDIIQSHHYSNARVDMAQRTIEICEQKQRDYPDRIHLFGEMGIHSKFSKGNGDDEDPTGVHLHQQSWAALVSACSSAPINWWHGGYFDVHDLYGVFKGIRKFTDALDLTRPWRSLGALETAWVEQPKSVAPLDLELSPRYRSFDAPPPVTTHTLGRDGSVNAPEAIPALLQGQAHRNAKAPLTLEVDLVLPGKLLIGVADCSNNPRLLVDLDGERVLEKPFPTAEGMGRKSTYQERWQIWQTTYDVEVEVPIPAGRHTVTLDNDGGDWLALSGLRLPGYVDQARHPFAAAAAMGDGREVFWWVRNTRYWWLPVARGDAIPTVPAFTVAVPVARAGRYTLQRWNTGTGEIEHHTTVEVTGPTYPLTVRDLVTDVAYRLLPLEG